MKYIGLFDEKEDIVTKEKLEAVEAAIPTKTSQLDNDSGFITSAPVTSVNTKTGAVTLSASDVGALPNTTVIPDKTSQLDNDSGYITNSALTDYAKKTEIPTKTSEITNDSGYITDAALTDYAKTTDVPTKISQLDNDSHYITVSGAPVQSVNNKTGAVSLTASDVGAVSKTGDTMTGNLTVGSASLQTNGYVTGTWLKTTANIASSSAASKIAVINDGWVYSRTPEQIKSDIGLGNVDNVKQYSATNPPPYPVTSVNGKTGAVTLSASDVSAIPSTLTGTAGQVLTKTVDGQEWKDAPVDENSVLLKNVGVTMPSVAYWQSVCYGNGKFVAVAGGVDASTTIAAYSTDGINWTQTTLPAKKNWYSVCYGNDKFVAVAPYSNIAAYSTDGITWNQVTLPSDVKWQSVCYGNGKFVVVTNDIELGNITAYSADGINWTQSTLPTSAYWQSVCYGNGKFVAVAYNSNIAAYSSNGINWTQSTLPTSTYWGPVCYGNDKFVAVAPYSNIAAYSTDGINWTQTTLPVSMSWQSVCYGNGKFVAVTYDSYTFAAYSTDGINWTHTKLPTRAKWQSVCYGNGKFVAVVYNSSIAAYSTDGIHWSSTTKALQYPDGTDIHEQVKEELQIKELPNVTTADNGKFLRVVSGAWAAAEIANANGGSF